MGHAIIIHHLTKRFERRTGWRPSSRPVGTTAVDDVSLVVNEGEIFGLLGPNGAGKTTLVKTLCTLISPTSGTATVAGYPLDQAGEIRQSVGLVVSDERSFYWRLSGWQNLEFFAAMVGLRGSAVDERINQVLLHVDMLAYAQKPFSDYSSGMRQRLAIARSLLHQPKILFLDEPSRSLDPTATGRLHRLIRELLVEQDMTIFLITHDLSEAEKLCRRVAVMHQARIQAVGPPADLRRRLQPRRYYQVQVGPLNPAAARALRELAPDLKQESKGERALLSFRAGETGGSLTAVLDSLRRHHVEIYAIEGHPPSLEEVFTHYTGEGEKTVE